MTESLRNHGDHGGATAVYVVHAPQWHRAFGATAINDGTTAELRRSWRCHCGLCRTSTAVAPRIRCDGGIRQNRSNTGRAFAPSQHITDNTQCLRCCWIADTDSPQDRFAVIMTESSHHLNISQTIHNSCDVAGLLTQTHH